MCKGETWASLIAQSVMNLPATQDIQVRFLVGKIPWRRKWHPTPVFLPGKPHGQRSLVGYRQWGCKELNTAERLTDTLGSAAHKPCELGLGSQHLYSSLSPFVTLDED